MKSILTLGIVLTIIGVAYTNGGAQPTWVYIILTCIGVLLILGCIMSIEPIANFNKKILIRISRYSSKENNLTEGEQKTMNIISTPRIAAVLAILLCITLYFALLSNVFTTKIDTYTCYIVDGQIHDINCYELDEKKPAETTVYEAIKHNKIHGCNFTNQTTITQKNYVVPLLISTPISVLVYFILTSKKFD